MGVLEVRFAGRGGRIAADERSKQERVGIELSQRKNAGRRGKQRTALIFSQGASSLTLRINRASARRMLVVRSIPAVEEVPPLASSGELSEATASGLYWVSGRGEERRREEGREGRRGQLELKNQGRRAAGNLRRRRAESQIC